MTEEKRGVAFKFHEETIEKLNECVRMKNSQLKEFGCSMSKQDYLEEIIRADYFRLCGETKDADIAEKIDAMVAERVERHFDKAYEEKIDNLIYYGARANRLLEIFMRCALGTYDEQVEKRMEISEIGEEEAIQALNRFLKRLETEHSPQEEKAEEEIQEALRE